MDAAAADNNKIVYAEPVLQLSARDTAGLLETSYEDLIIEMYALQCQKCVSLKPFFENMALVLRGSGGVKVVAVDGLQANSELQDGIASEELSSMLAWTRMQVGCVYSTGYTRSVHAI